MYSRILSAVTVFGIDVFCESGIHINSENVREAI